MLSGIGVELDAGLIAAPPPNPAALPGPSSRLPLLLGVKVTGDSNVPAGQVRVRGEGASNIFICLSHSDERCKMRNVSCNCTTFFVADDEAMMYPTTHPCRCP